MTNLQKSSQKEDTILKKSDRAQFSSNKGMPSNLLSLDKSTEALKLKFNWWKKKGSKVQNFMNLTSKNWNSCLKIKSRKVKPWAWNVTTCSMKNKYQKSDSNKKKINLKIWWPGLPMIWKGNSSTPKKNRAHKNLLKSKL